MNKIPRYQAIARALSWRDRVDDDPHFAPARHLPRETLARLMSEAPSGSGIDSGTQLSDESTPKKLVFELGFHHMDENGFYDGWTYHKAIVRPSLEYGFDLKITGPNRNDIKDYLYQVYEPWLGDLVDQYSKA